MEQDTPPVLIYQGYLDDIDDVQHVNFVLDGVNVILFPHNYETWLILRRKGHDPPSAMRYYNWPGNRVPRASQKQTAEFFTEHPKSFCLNGLGTGKTLSAVWAFDFLRREEKLKRVLIIAPKTIRYLVWVYEIFQALPRTRIKVLEGTRDRKQEEASNKVNEIIIVNPESLHLIQHHLVDVDLVVVDEFTKFKTPSSRRYKALKFIIGDAHTPRRMSWWMSATPAPQSPMDAYGPCKLINPEFPYSKRGWQQATMEQITEYTWVPKRGCEQLIYKYMQPSIRFTREECYEIEPVQTISTKVEMTSKQKKALEDLQNFGRVLVEDGHVTAVNAVSVFTKAQQIMLGFVYNEDGKAKDIGAQPLFDAVLDMVESSPRPVLVFAPFTEAVKKLNLFLTKHGINSKMIYGGIKQKDRDDTFREFRNQEIQSIVAVPSTMSHGLTLVEGNVEIWTVAPTSFEIYDQAVGRMARSGQDHQVLVYQFYNCNVGRKLFDRIRTRERNQDLLLRMYAEGVPL